MSREFIPSTWTDFRPNDGLLFTEYGLAELVHPEFWNPPGATSSIPMRVNFATTGTMGSYHSDKCKDFSTFQQNGSFTGTKWEYSRGWSVGNDGTASSSHGSKTAQTIPFDDYLTIAAWIYSRNASATASYVYFGGNLNEFGILQVSSNFWALSQMSGTNQKAISSSTVTANRWYFIVGLLLNSTDRRIYVDGVQDGTDTTALSLGGPQGGTAIGTRWSNDVQVFDGLVDSPVVYRGNISPSQIRAMYAAGRGGMYKVRLLPKYFVPAAAADIPFIAQTMQVN